MIYTVHGEHADYEATSLAAIPADVWAAGDTFTCATVGGCPLSLTDHVEAMRDVRPVLEVTA